MSRKLTTGQPHYDLLVANLREGSDPSRGPAGNPVKVRTMFTYQHFPEVNRLEGARGPVEDYNQPGITTHMGHVDYAAAPVASGATGSVTVLSTDFTAEAFLYLSDNVVISGDDYATTGGTPVVGEDITNTPPDNVIVIFKTSGAGVGEGTINYPANLPIIPGTVTINWTDGGAQTMTDDGAGGFVGASGNPAGSSIDYNTGEIVFDATGNAPDAATTITIDYTGTTPGDIATNLAAAISALDGFTAIPAGPVVNIVGPHGPDGNALLFEAIYEGAVQNFGLAPADGSLAGGEPFIGPPIITP